MKKLLISVCLALASLMLISCGGGKDPGTGTDNTEADFSALSDSEKCAYFTFETEVWDGENYVWITGVTSEGKKLSKLDLPEKLGEDSIYGLKEKCFEGCTALTEITVHSNVREWQKDLFTGCTSLKKVYMDYADFVAGASDTEKENFMCSTPNGPDVYGDGSILSGAKSAKLVFTDAAAYDYFCTDYNWASYASVCVKE